MTDSIDEAARRGWIDRAHRGLFPELAADLTGAYDVVSMHHYLEHTREPWDEIDAAAHRAPAGRPPAHRGARPREPHRRRSGGRWGPWFQPQHQHFLTVDNLSRELLQRGFSIVDVERGPAHQPVDLAFGMFLLANKLGGAPDKPWLPPSTTAHKIRRGAVFGLMALPMLGALVLDKALAPLVRAHPQGVEHLPPARLPGLTGPARQGPGPRREAGEGVPLMVRDRGAHADASSAPMVRQAPYRPARPWSIGWCRRLTARSPGEAGSIASEAQRRTTSRRRPRSSQAASGAERRRRPSHEAEVADSTLGCTASRTDARSAPMVAAPPHGDRDDASSTTLAGEGLTTAA